jgi:hypothetical protein
MSLTHKFSVYRNKTLQTGRDFYTEARHIDLSNSVHIFIRTYLNNKYGNDIDFRTGAEVTRVDLATLYKNAIEIVESILKGNHGNIWNPDSEHCRPLTQKVCELFGCKDSDFVYMLSIYHFKELRNILKSLINTLLDDDVVIFYRL